MFSSSSNDMTVLHFAVPDSGNSDILEHGTAYTGFHPGPAVLLLNKEAELFSLGNVNVGLDDTLVSLVEIKRHGGETPLDMINANIRAQHGLEVAKHWHADDPDAAHRLKQQYDQEAAEIIQLLLQHYQRVVTKKKGNGSLHWIIQEAVYENDGVVLPLGKLTMGQMVTLLNLLVTANPSVATVDVTGAVALHIACRRSETPLAVIQCLAELSPGTARMPDMQGNLPLHALCTSNPCLDKVKCLVVAAPDTVTMTNRLGFVPITVATHFDASLDVLYYMLQLSSTRDAETIENLRRSFRDNQV